MPLDDVTRLLHMRDAARAALKFMEHVERIELGSNLQLVFAVVKAVEIIGEAAANVSSSTREQYPQIPWYLIVGMRNRLVHGYFDVDLDQLWSTVTEDLPPLLAELETILPAVPPDYRSPFV